MTQTLTEIRALLASRGVRPKHRFGQNFLHDHNILRILVDAADLAPGHAGRAMAPLVLEVGPGTGALTELLLERGARVIACEIDRDMASILRERVLPRAEGRLAIVEGDCLENSRTLSATLRAALAAHGAERGFRLVANLPYGCATPLLTTLLVEHPECERLHATIQREVADRLVASPRSDAYGPIRVLVSMLAKCEHTAEVSPGCFWPEPEVTSAIVSIAPRARNELALELRTPDGCRRFDRFVTESFSRRRKQIGTILGRSFPFPAGIDAKQRPEELSPAQWLELWRLTQV